MSKKKRQSCGRSHDLPQLVQRAILPAAQPALNPSLFIGLQCSFINLRRVLWLQEIRWKTYGRGSAGDRAREGQILVIGDLPDRFIVSTISVKKRSQARCARAGCRHLFDPCATHGHCSSSARIVPLRLLYANPLSQANGVDKRKPREIVLSNETMSMPNRLSSSFGRLYQQHCCAASRLISVQAVTVDESPCCRHHPAAAEHMHAEGFRRESIEDLPARRILGIAKPARNSRREVTAAGTTRGNGWLFDADCRSAFRGLLGKLTWMM